MVGKHPQAHLPSVASSRPLNIVQTSAHIQSCQLYEPRQIHTLITFYFMHIMQIIWLTAVDLGFYPSVNHFATTEINSVTCD